MGKFLSKCSVQLFLETIILLMITRLEKSGHATVNHATNQEEQYNKQPTARDQADFRISVRRTDLQLVHSKNYENEDKKYVLSI